MENDVQFNEPTTQLRAERPVKGIAGWLIRNKFAKTKQGASVLILVIAVLAVCGTIFLWVSGFATGSSSGISPQERARLEAL